MILPISWRIGFFFRLGRRHKPLGNRKVNDDKRQQAEQTESDEGLAITEMVGNQSAEHRTESTAGNHRGLINSKGKGNFFRGSDGSDQGQGRGGEAAEDTLQDAKHQQLINIGYKPHGHHNDKEDPHYPFDHRFASVPVGICPPVGTGQRGRQRSNTHQNTGPDLGFLHSINAKGGDIKRQESHHAGNGAHADKLRKPHYSQVFFPLRNIHRQSFSLQYYTVFYQKKTLLGKADQATDDAVSDTRAQVCPSL